MISVSNTAVQTIEPGQSVTFDRLIWKSGCGEVFRNGGSAIRTGIGVFEVSFNGNIGGTVAATQVQLSIELGGSPLIGTNMLSVPAAIGDYNNVSARATYGNSPQIGGGEGITVTNTGTSPVTLAPGSLLTVKRVSCGG